jgi:hypothetical protein
MTFNVGSNTERMRINASGNLGLGVVPSAWGVNYKVLDIGTQTSVYSDSNVASIISLNQYIDAGGRKYKVNGTASFYEQYNGLHAWYTAPSGTAGNAISFTQAMTLDASGRLMLGTTTTDVFGIASYRASDSVYYKAHSGSTISYYGAATSLGVGLAGTFSNHDFAIYSNSSERLRITSGGNVGIGTTSTASTLLNIANTTSQNEIVFRGTDYTNIFSETTNGLQFGIASTGNSAAIEFFTNNSERLRISSGGNVGIGTTSPTSRFQSNNASTYNSSTPNGAIIASNLANGNAIIDIGVDSTYLGYIQSRNIADATPYNLLLNPLGGNVGVGTTSPLYKLDVNGGTSLYLLNLESTWNSSGTTGYGINLDITDTASAAGSYLLRLAVGGNQYFSVDKSGKVYMVLPTSSTGLSSGQLWNDNGTIKIV